MIPSISIAEASHLFLKLSQRHRPGRDADFKLRLFVDMAIGTGRLQRHFYVVIRLRIVELHVGNKRLINGKVIPIDRRIHGKPVNLQMIEDFRQHIVDNFCGRLRIRIVRCFKPDDLFCFDAFRQAPLPRASSF